MYGGGELLAVLAGSIRQILENTSLSSEGCRSCGSERDSLFLSVRRKGIRVSEKRRARGDPGRTRQGGERRYGEQKSGFLYCGQAGREGDAGIPEQLFAVRL